MEIVSLEPVPFGGRVSFFLVKGLMMREDREAILVVGMGDGDESKGAWVDYLARTKPVHTVVRFNGGAQAGHNVVTPDGRHHTFAQFGSASFVPGVRTHLSRYMLVNPERITHEALQLRAAGVTDAIDRLSIDTRALITTPFHIAMNRLRELARGQARHGSCGMGIGETMIDWCELGPDTLRAVDLKDWKTALKRLLLIQKRKIAALDALEPPSGASVEGSQWEVYARIVRNETLAERMAYVYADFNNDVKIIGPGHLGDLLADPGVTVFEGAQGVLLDEWHGFHPYTTWSTTTFKNAERLLADHRFEGRVTKIGLVRAYASRHGVGPMPTEAKMLSPEVTFHDQYNVTNPWQGNFRVGAFDAVLTRYALEVSGGVDTLAVSHLDQYTKDQPTWGRRLFCREYDFVPPVADRRRAIEQVGLDGLADYRYDPQRQGYVITRIRPSVKPHDLVYQEKLTELLGNCQPIYDIIDASEEALIATIEAALEVKIGFLGAGPTAEDRTERISA